MAAFEGARAEAMGVGSEEMSRIDPQSGIDVARIGAAAFAEARDGCEITLAGFRGEPDKAPADGAGAAALVSQVLQLTAGWLRKVELLVGRAASELPRSRPTHHLECRRRD